MATPGIQSQQQQQQQQQQQLLRRSMDMRLLSMMGFKRKRVQNVDEEEGFNLLDFPEVVLEEVLCKLDPHSLCSAAGTCKQLLEVSRSDRLWELLIKKKWGKIVTREAIVDWKKNRSTAENISLSYHNLNLAATGFNITGDYGLRRSLMTWPFTRVWPLFNFRPKPLSQKLACEAFLSSDSLMALYGEFETGVFSFSAQVYNREHGHVGFLISCYDAVLSYDSKTDSFKARYPPHGSRIGAVEEGISWERVRAPPVPIHAHELHLSDGSDVLRPGDHVEVQWRRSKDFPYGWWYGIVGHSDECAVQSQAHSKNCRCHLDSTVWLEFNQYAVGSRWRRARVNRRAQQEEGSEAGGFYGGIRKLHLKEEVSVWKHLWPTGNLN